MCRTKSDSEFDLCTACRREIQSESPVCRCCASPISATVSASDKDGKLCGSCLQHLPPYTSVYRFADYAPPLDRIIQDLKFNQKLHYAQLLGDLMAKDIRVRQMELPDILMPVPLHSQR
ncbi:ComF family protein, partial [Kaarinaea lacus]